MVKGLHIELIMIAITPSLSFRTSPPFDIIGQQLAHREAESKTLIGGVHRGELEWYTRVATPDI